MDLSQFFRPFKSSPAIRPVGEAVSNVDQRWAAPVNAYLSSPPPGYALLIAGDWGAGKSFFWSRYSLTLSTLNLTPVTFSAAGLQTTEDLERSLFHASISGLGSKTVREAGTVIGRALLRLVKVDPDDIRLKAAATGGKTVVCIDDLERFAGDFKVIFGFIVSLLDESGVHCILISDEKQAMKQEFYSEYKERIVGKTIEIEPDLRSFCEITIRGFATLRSREVLLGQLTQILEIAEKGGISNLRTIRFLLTEADYVFRDLPGGMSSSEGVQALISAVAFYAIATTRDVKNRALVAKAFSTPELGIALALHERAPERNEQGEMHQLISLLQEAGFTEEAYRWPASETFAKFVQGKLHDGAQLAIDFRLAGGQDDRSEEDPLKIASNYRAATDDKLRESIDVLRHEILNTELKDLPRTFEIFRVLYWLSKNGLLDLPPEDWTEQVLTSVAASAPVPSLAKEFDFWMGPYDENEKKVISALEDLANRSLVLKKAADAHLDRAAIVHGNKELPEAVGEPIFDGVDPGEFLDELVVGGQLAARRMQQFFRERMRVGNSADFVGNDRNFAEALSVEIDRRFPLVRPLTIQSSMLRELAHLLRQFVSYVDRYRAER